MTGAPLIILVLALVISGIRLLRDADLWWWGK